MAAPKEPEIRAFATKIGAIDENGNYTEPRSRLAAGAIEYRRELERVDVDVDATPTADRLVEFALELYDSELSGIDAIVAAVAGALVQRDGLHLRNEGIPHV